MYSTNAKEVVLNKKLPIIDMISKIKTTISCGSTYLTKGLDLVRQEVANRGEIFDNLILLTDSDCCNREGFRSGWSKLATDDISIYARNVFGNDLLGKGYSSFNTKHPGVHLISSFSDRMIEFINLKKELGSNDIKKFLDTFLEARYKRF